MASATVLTHYVFPALKFNMNVGLKLAQEWLPKHFSPGFRKRKIPGDVYKTERRRKAHRNGFTRKFSGQLQVS